MNRLAPRSGRTYPPTAMPLADAELILLAWARRELEPEAALAKVCATVVDGRPSARCGLVAGAGDQAQVLAGRLDTVETVVSLSAVAAAGSRRLLATRASGELARFGAVPDHLAWIAVEPLTSRNGLYLGSLVAGGEADDREAVLSHLPGAGLLCSEIGFELLWQRRLWRLMHQFNNVMAALSANVELVDALVPPEPAGDLPTAAQHAANGVTELLETARALNAALFNPQRR